MMGKSERFRKADILFNAYKYGEAIPILKSLAEEGYMPAQFHLGFCYENGAGLPQDNAKAIEWYGKAAQQGDDEALKKVNHLKTTLCPKCGAETTTAREGGSVWDIVFATKCTKCDYRKEMHFEGPTIMPRNF